MERQEYEPWIGVDLDKTLAEHEDGFFRSGKIGAVIPRMKDRIWEYWMKGKKVKIFTARAAHGKKEIRKIRDWLYENGLPLMEITNVKDPGMTLLLDDKARRVEENTGKLIEEEMKKA